VISVVDVTPSICEAEQQVMYKSSVGSFVLSQILPRYNVRTLNAFTR